MTGVLYLHQTSTDCVYDQCTHFGMPNVNAGYGKLSDLIVFFACKK